MMELWEHFYPCDCGSEGIMMSYENEENGLPYVDLAYYQEGFASRKLSFSERIKWCYHIFQTGNPWCDMVILNQNTAKRLGLDLIKFSERKIQGENIV